MRGAQRTIKALPRMDAFFQILETEGCHTHAMLPFHAPAQRAARPSLSPLSGQAEIAMVGRGRGPERQAEKPGTDASCWSNGALGLRLDPARVTDFGSEGP